ncbi:MAG: YaiI/YqxD family protein [Clostridia bacterium]|nr:YaiI/YqxD family protein [Clostridia bacterium]
MHLWIDADACPVVDLAIAIAARHQVAVTLVCDDAHHMQRDGARTITVSRGADSADLMLVNLLSQGDAVVTQDYGLAALCLARGAKPLDQNGRVYHEGNIDSLLGMRHVAKKVRRGGGRLKGPPKRTKEQDEWFEQSLDRLLSELTATT